ncbi:MAG: TlpA disulfide reductase family protein [Thermodesulforhabdaceae bacterium]
MTRGKILAFIVGLIVGIFSLMWFTTPRFQEIDLGKKLLHEGDPAPDFSLPSILDGRTVSLSDFRNSKTVLIYFWATWCPSCLEVRPAVKAIKERVSNDRLEVIAINIGAGDTPESIRKFERLHPLNVPVLFDKEGKVSLTYGVRGVPFFVIINPEGKITYQGHELPQEIERYLM